MAIADDRWVGLKGGYRQPYDARPALSRIEAGTDIEDAWLELWEELHHQGDVGEASYAAVPTISRLASGDHGLDWNAYALAATIEEARLNARNPKLPEWLVEDYSQAWRRLFEAGLAVLGEAEDESLISSIMAVIATHKRQPMLARLAILTEEERKTLLNEVGWA